MIELFEALGFRWDRSAVVSVEPNSKELAICRYKQMLPQFVYDASALEGNPFTFAEVKTLLDGYTVGGHRLSDEKQVLNLIAAAKYLFSAVKHDHFSFDKIIFDRLHSYAAEEKALEWGHFRGEGSCTDITPRIALGDGEFVPSHSTEPGANNLKQLFEKAVVALEHYVSDPREKGMAFFLFGALHLFYFNGNKQTSRFMMNGILMSHGFDAISVPAVRAGEFNEKMVHFFETRDGTEMMQFLHDCAPTKL